MSNFWEDEEDNISEYDLLEEAEEVEQLAAQYAQEPVVVEADEEEIEQILEDSAYGLDADEANIIYNTRIRLEQARLYEMLINHNLFDGVDADPSAVAIVQNELKHYIVKRLEILMGLRQPVQKESASSVFNPVEADFLKQLAFKGTKGASVSEAAEQAPPPRPKAQGLKPLTPTVKSSALKGVAKNPAPKRKKAPVQQAEQPLPQRPVNRRQKKRTTTQPSKRNVKVKAGAAPRDLRKDEVEALAKEDIEMMKGRKPFHEMSSKEKAKEIARVNDTHAPKPRPANALPMMGPDQQVMKYMTEQNMRASKGGGGKQNQFNQIMANIANQIAINKSQEE
jgi:hypothetical protein